MFAIFWLLLYDNPGSESVSAGESCKVASATGLNLLPALLRATIVQVLMLREGKLP